MKVSLKDLLNTSLVNPETKEESGLRNIIKMKMVGDIHFKLARLVRIVAEEQETYLQSRKMIEEKYSVPSTAFISYIKSKISSLPQLVNKSKDDVLPILETIINYLIDQKILSADNTKIIPIESQEDYIKEINKLEENIIDINFEKIDYNSLNGLSISPLDISLLLPFLTDE